MLTTLSKLVFDDFSKLYKHYFKQTSSLLADCDMQFQNTSKFFTYYISNQNQEDFEYFHIDNYILIVDYKKKVIEIFNEFEILTYQNYGTSQLKHCVNCSKMYLTREK